MSIVGQFPPLVNRIESCWLNIPQALFREENSLRFLQHARNTCRAFRQGMVLNAKTDQCDVRHHSRSVLTSTGTAFVRVQHCKDYNTRREHPTSMPMLPPELTRFYFGACGWRAESGRPLCLASETFGYSWVGAALTIRNKEGGGFNVIFIRLPI